MFAFDIHNITKDFSEANYTKDLLLRTSLATIDLMLQNRPPNIGRHQFIVNECKDWFSNPSITKAVIFHLVSVKKGDDDSNLIIKQMNLVTVTFDQTNEESVTSTVVSVFSFLDDDKLPALAKTPAFQMKTVDLLNKKLNKS